MAGLAAVLSGVAYYVVAADATEWPGGSSGIGFLLGIVGSVLILFECLYWARKKVRTWRLGTAQAWLRAHIWLGLLTVPLLFMHSGFRFGGLLSTVLMVILLLVVGSGVVGLILQQFLPRQLLTVLPGESPAWQLDQECQYIASAARQLLEAVKGNKAAKGEADWEVLGDVRVEKKSKIPALTSSDVKHLDTLFEKIIDPFLRGQGGGKSPLRSPYRAAMLFQDLKADSSSDAEGVIDQLAHYCEQRRELDTQRQLHFWLHGWLLIHLPLSVALVVLMFLHAWVAVKYW